MAASLILRAVSVLLCLKQLSFTRIIPRPNKPIELDITNQNQVGDYFFHFYLEEDTLPGSLPLTETTTCRSSSPRELATTSSPPATHSSCLATQKTCNAQCRILRLCLSRSITCHLVLTT